MSQAAAALPDVIRDFERTPADIVRQAGEFASSILADVAGRRGALHGRIQPLATSMRFGVDRHAQALLQADSRALAVSKAG